jgi:hypothetical protein
MINIKIIFRRLKMKDFFKKFGYIFNLALDGWLIGLWVGHFIQLCRGIELDKVTIGVSLIITIGFLIKMLIKDLTKSNIVDIKINIKGEIE